MAEQTPVIAETISHLETQLAAAQHQIELHQADVSRLRIILQCLKNDFDVASFLQNMKKVEASSSSKVDISTFSNLDVSNGHQHSHNQNGIDTGFRDRYLHTLKGWITDTVLASATPLTAGQIFRMGMQAGIKMHKNYPYNVLKQLFKEGILRRVGRGFINPKMFPAQNQDARCSEHRAS